MRKSVSAFKLRAFLLAVALFLCCCCFVKAADLAYPLTGTTKLHDFKWRLRSTADGLSHTSYFDIEKIQLFNPIAWQPALAVRQYVEDICLTSEVEGEQQTWCRWQMPDRGARYRVRACNAASLCSPWVEEPASELARCCHLPEFASECHFNHPVPVDCQ